MLELGRVFLHNFLMLPEMLESVVVFMMSVMPLVLFSKFLLQMEMADGFGLNLL